MELTSMPSNISKAPSPSSTSKNSFNSWEGDNSKIIKEGFVYIKCKNITYQHKVKRYLTLTENSLEVYDVTTGMMKIHVDLSDTINEIYICDVHEKKKPLGKIEMLLFLYAQ